MVDRESRRVHISGLNPTQCSLQDLRSRFNSFQLQVSDIYNWPPGKDAVGNVQNWCFLTLEGESAKIKRAIQVLNGTVWKGTKLRIRGGKDQGASTRAENSAQKVEDVHEEKEKKVKKKSKRVESENIHTPVKPKDVDEGLWGWYKTPAGHLVRPIHTRPDHPLPKPGARLIEIAGEESKKRKRRSIAAAKPLSRAKRVTLDPSRYGSRHLSGLMLDDGSEALPTGYQWICEEAGSGGDVEWSLLDSKGNVIKTERVFTVRRRDTVAEEEVIFNDDGDNGSVMKDLEDAFDNASSASSSDEDKDELSSSASSKMKIVDLIMQGNAPYDPGNESDFSEGYQEMQSEVAVLVKPWQEEKEGQIGLLKRMFGTLPEERVLPVPREKKITNAEEGESDKEGAEQTATSSEVVQPTDPIKEAAHSRAQKRAALLNSLTPSDKSRNFNPIVRFDPGLHSNAEQEPRQADGKLGKLDSINVQEPVAPAAEIEDVPTIQMASLKDMFRPKEDTAGFSLLADLDLDLEEESEEEEEVEEVVDGNQTTSVYKPAPNAPLDIPVPTLNSTSSKLPLFFPTFDGEDRSWLGILQKDPSVKPFRRDKTDEEIQAIWNERKRTLTQEYKRRHREALKKKKRRYTGSRDATNSLSM